MNIRINGRTIAAAITLSIAAVTATGSLPATAAPSVTARQSTAAAGTHGLFGSQDPSYDGVFRQGLSILALRAAGAPVPTVSVNWLLSQQCPDGGFQAFRPSTKVACLKSDPVFYRGEDTNSTALAIAALSYTYSAATRAATAQRLVARARALAWLLARQNANGGWAYYPGGASDANSTGVVLAGIRAAGLAGGTQHRGRGATAATFLRHVQVPCNANPRTRGGLAYQLATPLSANSSATAQGAWGLLSQAIVSPRRLSYGSPPLFCVKGTWPRTQPVQTGALTHLNYVILVGRGAIPGAFGPGPDLTTTAFAVLALVAGGHGGRAVATAMSVLKANARTYVLDSTHHYVSGRLAVLILAAHATGANPANFGGVNLVARLLGTRTP